MRIFLPDDGLPEMCIENLADLSHRLMCAANEGGASDEHVYTISEAIERVIENEPAGLAACAFLLNTSLSMINDARYAGLSE